MTGLAGHGVAQCSWSYRFLLDMTQPKLMPVICIHTHAMPCILYTVYIKALLINTLYSIHVYCLICRTCDLTGHTRSARRPITNRKYRRNISCWPSVLFWCFKLYI